MFWTTEQWYHVRAVGVKKVVINVTVLCRFLLFFILFFFLSGLFGVGSHHAWNKKKTTFEKRIKAFFLNRRESYLAFSFNFISSITLDFHTALVSFFISFSCSLVLLCVVVNDKLKQKNIMSFKVPKLNDSELGCIKSWWQIKIEPPVGNWMSLCCIISDLTWTWNMNM